MTPLSTICVCFGSSSLSWLDVGWMAVVFMGGGSEILSAVRFSHGLGSHMAVNSLPSFTCILNLSLNICNFPLLNRYRNAHVNTSIAAVHHLSSLCCFITSNPYSYFTEVNPAFLLVLPQHLIITRRRRRIIRSRCIHRRDIRSNRILITWRSFCVVWRRLLYRLTRSCRNVRRSVLQRTLRR